MGFRPAAFVVSVAAGAALAGCGDDAVDPPARRAAAEPAVTTNDYVATPTLSEGSSERLFSIPLLGHFRATCTGPARAEISYKAARGTATQLVTTENRGFSSNGHVNPGQRMAVAIGRPLGPRAEWQVALLSAGRIKVATATFTVGRVAGSHGCLLSGKAEVAERQR
jgi:hypothetical protein